MIADKVVSTQILQDIDALQLAPSERLFDAAAKLFLDKWKYLLSNLKYFESEWMRSHKGLIHNSISHALHSIERTFDAQHVPVPLFSKHTTFQSTANSIEGGSDSYRAADR